MEEAAISRLDMPSPVGRNDDWPYGAAAEEGEAAESCPPPSRRGVEEAPPSVAGRVSPSPKGSPERIAEFELRRCKPAPLAEEEATTPPLLLLLAPPAPAPYDGFSVPRAAELDPPPLLPLTALCEPCPAKVAGCPDGILDRPPPPTPWPLLDGPCRPELECKPPLLLPPGPLLVGEAAAAIKPVPLRPTEEEAPAAEALPPAPRGVSDGTLLTGDAALLPLLVPALVAAAAADAPALPVDRLRPLPPAGTDEPPPLGVVRRTDPAPDVPNMARNTAQTTAIKDRQARVRAQGRT